MSGVDIVTCAQCGGENVQCLMWVRVNTNKPIDDYGSWNDSDNCWCEDCAENVTLVRTGVLVRYLAAWRAKKDAGVCPSCDQTPGAFRDSLSRREHAISGLCQACQDMVFNALEGDNDE